MFGFLKKEKAFSQNDEKQPLSKPELTETAWSNTNFFGLRGSGTFEPFDPDILKSKRGANVYREMLRDSQVKAAFELLINSIISREYYFELPDDSEKQAEIERFFRYNIETQLRGTFAQALRSVLMGKAFGYSISEKNFDNAVFEGKGRWVLRSVKQKPFESFIFNTDHFGNVTKLYQYQDSGKIELDPKKFIIFINRPEVDPIFGESDLRACYRPYWEKNKIQDFWNIHMERCAGGFLIANPTDDAPSLTAAEFTQLQNVLKNITASSAVIAPAGYKFDVIYGQNTDEFEKAIAFRNREIARALLVPSLLGFTDQQSTGSYSQSSVQEHVFFNLVSQQAGVLADTLNEQLFAELARWNYGVSEFPRICFESLSTAQKQLMAEQWRESVKAGIVSNEEKDEKRTRELLNYPEPEEYDTQEKEPEENEVQEPEAQEQEPVEKMAEIIAPAKQIDNVNPMPSFEKRVNFAENKKALDDMQESFVSVLVDGANRFYAEIAEQSREIVRTDDLELVDTLSISQESKDILKNAVLKQLQGAYSTGRIFAQDELADASKANNTENLRAIFTTKERASRKTDWSVLDFIYEEGFDIISAQEYFALKADLITEESLSLEMQKAAHQVLLNAIRSGWSIEQTMSELEQAMQPFIGRLDPATGEVQETPQRLESLARTNIVDAFNQAQVSTFMDPELGDFVEALQYSAILDNRTTPFCNTYHGRIFAKTDPIWNAIVPPNHFNCRSRTIAVTKFDDYELSEKDTTVQPDVGFGRF